MQACRFSSSSSYTGIAAAASLPSFLTRLVYSGVTSFGALRIGDAGGVAKEGGGGGVAAVRFGVLAAGYEGIQDAAGYAAVGVVW